jgi:NitT/TauT family transport system substrate-binding protein
VKNILKSFALVFLTAASALADGKTVLRVGHFPNISHVQALVAHNLSRQGKGWFEQRLGPGVEIQWFIYNAGPSAMEAIFADSIDLTYVGPSPVINAYSKSQGEELRILSGAANGGTALLVHADSTLKTPADFRGKKIATPQLGNTQDISCRAWLAAGGLKITQLGGDAQILPTENPDQLALFRDKQIDAVWTVEPWVSRIEREAGGKVIFEEPDTTITVLASGVKFLKEKREMAKKFVQAHRELTEWIQKNPEEAQKLVLAELTEETHGKINAELIAHAWKRIVLTNEITLPPLEKFVANARAAGFIRTAPDLSRLIEKL